MIVEPFLRVKSENRAEWLRNRLKGVGGSDCSAIVGFNPYKTNVELWKEKISDKYNEIPDNKAMKYGRNTEDAIRTIFQADYDGVFKVSHFENELLISHENEGLRASLDGEIDVLKDVEIMSYFKNWGKNPDIKTPQPKKIKKGMKGVLEIKTTELMSSIKKEQWNNQVPMNYYCQVLHYLIVTNYDFAILRALINTSDENDVKTSHTRTYVFLRDEEIESINFLKQKELEFLEYVHNKKEPPLVLNV